MVVKTWKYEEAAITIDIDYDKCTGAAVCVDVCPSDCFEIVEGKSTVPRIDACVECCSCTTNCPEAAITHSSC